jgi:hypothetical protein
MVVMATASRMRGAVLRFIGAVCHAGVRDGAPNTDYVVRYGCRRA